MAHIIPFRGLRFNENKVGSLERVTTPPYDIISPEEQAAYYEKHPNNVIRLELGLEYPNDTPENNRYTRAAQELSNWIQEQVLLYEEKPAIYLYEEIFTLGDGTQKSFKGFMTLVELVEFSKKIVLPHEETLSKAKEDRFRLMDATHANFSPIYCLYIDPGKKLSHIIADTASHTPDVSFVASDGIRQNLWIITDENVIGSIQAGFADKQLFIADGHHRYETALRYRDQLLDRHPDSPADALFHYVMMLLVDMDDPGLVVLPTHRILRDLAAFSEGEILSALSARFDVNRVETSLQQDALAADMQARLAQKAATNAFIFYSGGNHYFILSLKDQEAMRQELPDKSDAYRGLDVSVLHTLILQDVFGIDMENMANQKNLLYTKQAEEAIAAVQNGSAQCAFLLNATKVREIKEVSLQNEKMPQKSTYFYPKIITGLVMNKFDIN